MGRRSVPSQQDMGPRCRHYSAIDFVREQAACAGCAKGHPIRKIVSDIVGSEIGILYKLPCHPGPDKATDCADYAVWTEAELAERGEAAKERAAQAAKMMAAASIWKREMSEQGLAEARRSCPCCAGADTVLVMVALNVNGHIRCRCQACGRAVIE